MHREKGNGAERNVIMKNIVEPIKSKKDLERIEKFLEHHSKRNRLIFAFGINTGLRVSDILWQRENFMKRIRNLDER